MIEISCFYADDDEFNEPINITFIKYEKFMKIAINEKKMIIKIENLKKSQFLFEYYILSLLCTKDLNKTYLFNNEIYCVLTNKYWNNSIFSDKYNLIRIKSSSKKDPLLSQEPKRESSFKKQSKFFKLMYHYFYTMHIKDPFHLIKDYISSSIERTDMTKIIEYEKKIEILSCIRGANRDVYSNVMKFM
jgi:hypothetical protein